MAMTDMLGMQNMPARNVVTVINVLQMQRVELRMLYHKPSDIIAASG